MVVQDMSQLGGELVELEVEAQQMALAELHGDILVMARRVVRLRVEMVVRHIIMAQLMVGQEDVEVTYKQLVLLAQLPISRVVTFQMVVLMLLLVELRVLQELQMVRLVQHCRAIQEKLINGVYYGRQFKVVANIMLLSTYNTWKALADEWYAANTTGVMLEMTLNDGSSWNDLPAYPATTELKSGEITLTWADDSFV